MIQSTMAQLRATGDSLPTVSRYLAAVAASGGPPPAYHRYTSCAFALRAFEDGTLEMQKFIETEKWPVLYTYIVTYVVKQIIGIVALFN